MLLKNSMSEHVLYVCQVELIGPPMGLAGMMGGGGGGMGHMDVDMYSGSGGGGYPRGRSAGPPLANPSVFNINIRIRIQHFK